VERGGRADGAGEEAAALEGGAIEIEVQVAGLAGIVNGDDIVLGAGSTTLFEVGRADEDEGGGVDEDVLLPAGGENGVMVAELK